MNLETVKKRYAEDLKHMVELERKAVEEQHERQRKHGERKITYNAAYNIAYERVCNWIQDAGHEGWSHLLDDPLTIAKMMVNCRASKVWAVIMGITKED